MVAEFYKPFASLCQQVFLSSGTFVMPADVIDNEILVATTGGGGAGLIVKHKPSKPLEAIDGAGGGGAGVSHTTLTMQPGTSASVLVGGKVASAYFYRNRYAFNLSSSPGGTSSFAGAKSCPGGEGVTIVKEQDYSPATVSGGGNGEAPRQDARHPHIYFVSGGKGPHGGGRHCADAAPGSGAGAGEVTTTGNYMSGTGIVVVYYYKKVLEAFTHGNPNRDMQYAIIKDNIVENIIVAPQDWNGPGINISNSQAIVPYINISDEDLEQVHKRYRSVGIGDTYNPATDEFISASLTIDYRWDKEQKDRLHNLLNQ